MYSMYIDMKMTSPLHTSQVRKLVPARKSVPTRKLVRVWSLNSKVNTYLFTDFYGTFRRPGMCLCLMQLLQRNPLSRLGGHMIARGDSASVLKAHDFFYLSKTISPSTTSSPAGTPVSSSLPDRVSSVKKN